MDYIYETIRIIKETFYLILYVLSLDISLTILLHCIYDFIGYLNRLNDRRKRKD